MQIVGVVATTRDERIDALPRPRVYRPFSFTAWDQPSILVRTEQDPEEIIPALRAPHSRSIGTFPRSPSTAPCR